MKIKFNSGDNLSLKKKLELRNMVIVVRSLFHKGDKYYLQDLYRLVKKTLLIVCID